MRKRHGQIWCFLWVVLLLTGCEQPQGATLHSQVPASFRGQIAFVQDGWLRLIRLPTRDIQSIAPAPLDFDWSPDGRELVVARDAPAPLTRIAIADQRTIDIGNAGATTVVWSPANTILYDSRYDTTVTTEIQPDGVLLRTLAAPVAGGSRWSPDGQYVLYRCAPNLCVMHRDETAIHRLPGPAGDLGSWSHDSTRIALTIDGDIYTVDRDATNLQRLTSDSDRQFAPIWSPDGAFIAYFEQLRLFIEQDVPPPLGGGDRVGIMRADGTDRHVISQIGAERWSVVGWSPDSATLAIIGRGMDAAQGKDNMLYVVDRNGTMMVKIAENVQHVQWNPALS